MLQEQALMRKAYWQRFEHMPFTTRNETKMGDEAL